MEEIADPQQGEPRSNQISDSFASGEDNKTPQLFALLAAQGQTILYASGDVGAIPDYGGTLDEQFITFAGGTQLSMNGNGASYQQEVAWSGSGGGILSNEATPSYQLFQGLDVGANGGSTTFRNFPDVSINQVNMLTVHEGTIDQGGTIGTSLAAPLWAGVMAMVNEQNAANGLPPIGFPNPRLYAIAASSAYSTAFNDITSGDNPDTLDGGTVLQFNAGPGYDNVTGLGSPQCGLIDALSVPPQQQPPPSLPLEIDATETEIGPAVCLSGTGFPIGANVSAEFSGIPGRTAPLAGNDGVVAPDGSYELGPDLANNTYEFCSAAELGAVVTITVSTISGPPFSRSATMPAAFFCTNGGASILGAGCTCNGSPPCAP